jgi:uncharacterized protein YbjT (DUF2867 family)
MPAYKRIAVIGGSGLLGQPVVKQLAKAGFDLTLISRDSAKLKTIFGGESGIKYVQAAPSDSAILGDAFKGDLASVYADCLGIDAIVSVIGSLALPDQLAYIDAAVEAGVNRFIPSEFGCDTQAPHLYYPSRDSS